MSITTAPIAEPAVEPVAETDSLDSRTIAELKVIAAAEGVELTGLSLKADIIEAIETKRGGK